MSNREKKSWNTAKQRCAVKYSVLYLRLFRYGWEPERSISEPKNRRK